jgi:hypothetical protein
MRRFVFRAFQITALILIAGSQARAAEESAFLVTEDCGTLQLVALCAYGTTSNWRKIADWNSLAPPYHLKTGQKLLLKEPPRLTPEESELALLKYWRSHPQLRYPSTF